MAAGRVAGRDHSRGMVGTWVLWGRLPDPNRVRLVGLGMWGSFLLALEFVRRRGAATMKPLLLLGDLAALALAGSAQARNWWNGSRPDRAPSRPSTARSPQQSPKLRYRHIKPIR
jgi:hypothetical protein